MSEEIWYKVREKSVNEVKNKEIITTKRVVIMETYRDNDGIEFQIPSILNGYLYESFKNTSINNAKNAAYVLCSFLNYVKLQVIEDDDELFEAIKKKGLYGLDFYHVASYLNFCLDIKNNADSTVKSYEKQILKFYKYLKDAGILGKSVKLTYVLAKVQGSNKKKLIIENPFDKKGTKVHYSGNKKGRKIKLNNMEEHIWQLFLEVSEKYEPSITLAIAYQMFGGLRRGEIVNLCLNSVKKERSFDRSMMCLFIRDNQENIFNTKDVELDKCQVKKERDQQVFNFNSRLHEYYNKHLKLRENILKVNKKKTEALFVDNNGDAMDGKTYQRFWSRVKRRFLIALKESSYSYYYDFCNQESVWSTHIGRGIFTNLCLEYGLAKTARELANLRGDRNEKSSIPYIDLFKQAKKIIKTLNILGEDVEGEKYR